MQAQQRKHTWGCEAEGTRAGATTARPAYVKSRCFIYSEVMCAKEKKTGPPVLINSCNCHFTAKIFGIPDVGLIP